MNAFGICGRIMTLSRRISRGCFTAPRLATPITRPASGTSQRRCFAHWRTSTTSASTICWGRPAGKNRTQNSIRPRQAVCLPGTFPHRVRRRAPSAGYFSRCACPLHIFSSPEYDGMSGKAQNSISEVTSMCNNNGLCGCLNNNWWWIVILILLLCNCGGWNGCENNNNGCGCGC